MTIKRLLVLAGDGIGPEVMAEARRVAQWFIYRHDLPAELVEAPFGLSAYEATGDILPTRTLEEMHRADAILFGAMGGPEYERIPAPIRRAGSLLRIRKELGLFANVRPVRHWPMLGSACPLRDEVAAGTDLVIVRENISGIFYGVPRGIENLPDGGRRAYNTQSYTTDEIERVARVAFELARNRRGEVCSIDKSNVLISSAFWRDTVQQLHDSSYPDVRLRHMLVDNCNMQLMSAPSQFDVLLADNMFGDILSEGAGAIAGSLGLLPSASLGDRDPGGRLAALYEPVHGSAPDIAGMNIANPLAAILSFALCLRYTFRLPEWAELVENAVRDVLAAGYATRDIVHPGARIVGTREMGDAVLSALEQTSVQLKIA